MKNSRVIVLVSSSKPTTLSVSDVVSVQDEATSSVDVETDAKLQRTIQTEFTKSTLLCIAHRLNTIGMLSVYRVTANRKLTNTVLAYYDRVMVMDEGRVAEFDTVLNLFDKEDSIFRSLCDEANLQRADIVRIRSEHDEVVPL